jgi:glucan phosphoethanolaminetransferase (alkaline phosphatase superfamily)
VSRLGRLAAASLVVLVAVGLLDRMELLRTVQFQLARLDAQHPLRNAAVYLCTYLGAVLGLTVALCHRRSVRIPVLVVTLSAACAQAAVSAVNGVGITHHEAWLLLTESQFLGASARFFLPRYAPAAGSALVGGALAAWLAVRVGPALRSWLWLMLPLGAGIASYQVIDQTFGKVYEFPPPFRVALVTTWAWQHRLPVYAEREAPYFRAQTPPLVDHVLLIVDESISGHWLGANGAPVDTTPWLSSRPAGVFNYGIATSNSNLSSTSNLLLQTGLLPAALPDRELRALRGPNLFSYLSAAGYHTALIDAQTYSDAPPNLMTGYDLRRIDSVSRLREIETGLPEYAVDFAAIPRLRALVEEYPRSFAYVIKTGAHLPYDDKAPAADKTFSADAASGPERIRRDYWDAIRWTTDHFLFELSRELEASGREVLVIYTSDHGQWLADERTLERKISPHATVLAPPAEQASVPLLLLAFGPRTRALLAQRFAARLVDGTSAHEIFPTVLQVAGYAAPDTDVPYGPSLFEADIERGPRKFVSGNIFGSNAGAYVLNRGMGDDCYLNDFDVDSVRVSSR